MSKIDPILKKMTLTTIGKCLEEKEYRANIAKEAKGIYIEITCAAASILGIDSNAIIDVVKVLEKSSISFLWLKKYCVLNSIIPTKKEVYIDEEGEFHKSNYPNRKGEHVKTEYWRADRDIDEVNLHFNDLKYALKYLEKLNSNLKQ